MLTLFRPEYFLEGTFTQSRKVTLNTEQVPWNQRVWPDGPWIGWTWSKTPGYKNIEKETDWTAHCYSSENDKFWYLFRHLILTKYHKKCLQTLLNWEAATATRSQSKVSVVSSRDDKISWHKDESVLSPKNTEKMQLDILHAAREAAVYGVAAHHSMCWTCISTNFWTLNLQNNDSVFAH